MEGYEAAVAEAKDERLNLLMKQTGDFLAQMGILVAKEKVSLFHSFVSFLPVVFLTVHS